MNLQSSHAGKIGPDLIEDYKSWRATTPLNRNGWPVVDPKDADSSGASPKTLQFEVQTLGSFFRHGVRLKLIQDNPVACIRAVRLKKGAPVFLEVDEIRSFLEAAKEHDVWTRGRRRFGSLLHDIFMVYLKTGMRLEELRNLEWTDVDLCSKEINIPDHKEVRETQKITLPSRAVEALKRLGKKTFSTLDQHERERLFRKLVPKSDLNAVDFDNLDLDAGWVTINRCMVWNPKSTGRVIPISPGLLGILKTQPRKSNFVFPDPTSGGHWRFKINDMVKRCVKRAGITKSVHTHTLRHTFATQLRKNGVSLETLKELLGHEDFKDTLRYAQFGPEEGQRAIPQIDVF